MINVEITRGGTESTGSVLKRFTRKVQGAGILPRVRSLRYAERSPSKYVKKKKALKSLVRRETHAELLKLGKIKERTPHGGKQ